MSLSLVDAFTSRHFALATQEHVYTINGSGALARGDAAAIVAEANYAAIMSPHRRGSELQFTLVPYKKPDTFEKPECEKRAIGTEELWLVIKTVKSLVAEPDSPIYVGDIKIFESLRQAQEQALSQACNRRSSLVIDYVYEAPPQGKVLDLGCGKGVNTLGLLQKGWTVTAVDIHDKALTLFSKSVPPEFKEQLTLVHADVSIFPFPMANDLVICVDVLPYIASSKLRKVLEKIHNALVPGGRFIGTIFFSPDDPKDGLVSPTLIAIELLRKQGAHFYPEASVIPAMLESSGFRVEECSFRRDTKELSPICVQFTATKAS